MTGKIAELWHQRLHVPDGARHLRMQNDVLNKGVLKDADKLRKDRFPDLVDFETGKVVEVKHVAGKLSEREVGDVSKLMDGDSQLADHLRLIGKETPGDVAVEIKKVEYVFVNPKGGAANIDTFWKLALKEDRLSIRFFASGGDARAIDGDLVRELIADHGWSSKTMQTWIETGKPPWPI